jgi:N,N'-diacetyllegionaminate synthase
MDFNKVFIIAEAGVNHNGDIKLAYKLVDAAVEAGVDVVKFQTFKSENLVTKTASKAEYQKETTEKTETQFQMLKKLELSFDDQKNLSQYCHSKKIQFLSTPFDLESCDFLYSLNMPIFKIPSGEITNLPYLRKIASYKKKIIISTGMATLGEIEDALNVFKMNGYNDIDISILHCCSEYPCETNSINLNAIKTLRSAFNLNTGFSDHSLGIVAPIAAIALGATIIEKHFTLDKSMEGPDHRASLNPKELKEMVEAIRFTELALGSGIKKPTNTEIKNKIVARKSIVAATSITAGEYFTEKNLCTKRPGYGITPMLIDNFIGTQATRSYQKDEVLQWN